MPQTLSIEQRLVMPWWLPRRRESCGDRFRASFNRQLTQIAPIRKDKRQKAEGKRQKAESSRQKAVGRSRLVANQSAFARALTSAGRRSSWRRNQTKTSVRANADPRLCA